jgi:hypothetical protein
MEVHLGVELHIVLVVDVDGEAEVVLGRLPVLHRRQRIDLNPTVEVASNHRRVNLLLLRFSFIGGKKRQRERENEEATA